MIVKNNKRYSQVTRAIPARNHNKVMNEYLKNCQKKQVYEKIMRELMPILNEHLDEDDEINELFGFGSSVKEPPQALTAEYIKEASVEDLTDVMGEYMNYWMAKAGDSIDKALQTSSAKMLEICKNNSEGAKKIFGAMIFAVKKGLTGAGNLAANIGRGILMACAFCVKMVANGIDIAKNALVSLYKNIAEFLKNSYANLKNSSKKGVDTASDKLQIFCKVAMAVILLIANKIQGAAQAFGEWLKTIIADVKEKVNVAVMICRSWFAVKSKEVADFMKDQFNNVRQSCVEAWNKLDKAARKAWNKATDKIISWVNNVRITLSKLGEKITATVNKAGDAIISGKDKVMVAGINKAVKALSSKYSEDDVVAIVRKAYNEGIKFAADGSCVINESYYMNTKLQLV